MPKITFDVPEQLTIDVPEGTTILDAAEKAHAWVGHACGGKCACSTCHVYVKQGFDSLSDLSEKEEDILDKAFDVRPDSRLGCQAKVGDEDLVCQISRESRQAWLDEHPEERERIKAGAGTKKAS